MNPGQVLLAIDLCEGFLKVRGRLARVPEHGLLTTRTDPFGRLRRPRKRVHPMPALRRDDRVEFPACSIPGFEGRHFDFHSRCAARTRPAVVRVDSEHPTTGRLKLARHDASANPHVENESARDRSENALDQVGGVARPGAVIALGIRAKDSAASRC